MTLKRIFFALSIRFGQSSFEENQWEKSQQLSIILHEKILYKVIAETVKVHFVAHARKACSVFRTGGVAKVTWWLSDVIKWEIGESFAKMGHFTVTRRHNLKLLHTASHRRLNFDLRRRFENLMMKMKLQWNYRSENLNEIVCSNYQ